MSSRSSRTERASRPPRPRRPRRPPPPEADDRVLVGVVVRPHGVRGELKVEPLSDVPDRFAPGSRLFLVRRGAAPGEVPEEVIVERSRVAAGGLLVGLVGVGDRDAAEALRGAHLEVGLDRVPPLADGLYYHFQLVGCRCVDAALGELGRVEDLLGDGGGLLLLVEGDGRRLLVPFVAEQVVAVDVAAKRIDLRLPPGLLEACASTS